MNVQNVRVRFAPAPTGTMHIGNVRSALVNYLFAQRYHGTFIVRIEDTDNERLFDPEGKEILNDLAWLDLKYQEGPGIGGSYAPYYQSQRTALYQHYLDTLIEKECVYRCFCSPEELNKKRERQIAQGLPPRYDRTCAHLSSKEEKELLEQGKPFVWRFKLPATTVTLHDLARGDMTFDLRHFADFPITRQDGSFTFLFSNCIDDITMRITHVFRGEEHLSNSAVQICMYEALNSPVPTFYHLPLLCTAQGRKMSKRDFGFSLKDLKAVGYLPEAICNYLAILGCSFEQEIMSVHEIAEKISFTHNLPTGSVQYDPEKLKWINHKWIQRIEFEDFVERTLPYLLERHPCANRLPQETLYALLRTVRDSLYTLADIKDALNFFFETPLLRKELLDKYNSRSTHELWKAIIAMGVEGYNSQTALSMMKEYMKTTGTKPAVVYTIFRIAMSGQESGLGINELLSIMPAELVIERLTRLVNEVMR